MPEERPRALQPFSAWRRELATPIPGACGTTNKLAKIWILRTHYAGQVASRLRQGVGPTDLLRTQFPFLLPDARVPPTLSIELTNYCNLRCAYCTSPLKLRAQGLMDETTFSRLVDQIVEAGGPSVYVCGNGEPTLHPQFATYMRRLSQSTRFLTLTTNWERVTDEVLGGVLDAPVHSITISVDGGCREEYEASRIGGSFDTLLKNLGRLRDEKRRRKAKLIVNVRLMLRPSQVCREAQLLDFWRPYADEVSRQYITDWAGVDNDVFALDCRKKVFPRCTLPFKTLNVNWNGNVPLCTYSHSQSGLAEGLLLGNVNTSTLTEMWRGPLISQYRQGHKTRNPKLMPICEGCAGC